MKSIRRNFCRALPVLAALLGFSASAQTIVFSNSPTTAIPRRSSIILIVANGLGYGDLSCYGQTKFQTPNLDKLAAEGIRFTDYFAENDSSKSQSVLMFGKNSGSSELTVAQILKNSGYHTGFIGQWDLGDENSLNAPWKKGFDEFAGYFDAGDAKIFYADYMWRLNPDFTYDESYNDPINGHWREWNKANGTPTPGKEEIYANTQGNNQYIPDLYTKAACSFIKDNAPDELNHYRPFLLVLNYPIPGDGSGVVPSDAPYSDEPWPQPEKNKAAMISRLDDYVSQIREQLRKLGMTNNVAIFFTSDSISKKGNGVDLNFFHGNISAKDLRVPMIVCWPDNLSAARVSGGKWSVKDFLPTAAEIGYAKTPERIDGKSVLPAVGYQR